VTLGTAPDCRQRGPVMLVTLHKPAGLHLDGLHKVERRWRTRARNVVGRVQVILT